MDLKDEIIVTITTYEDGDFNFEVRGVDDVSPVELVGYLELLKNYVINNDIGYDKRYTL